MIGGHTGIGQSHSTPVSGQGKGTSNAGRLRNY